MEPIRRAHAGRPAILFVYNYFEFSKHLRNSGVRAYSMTINLSGGHLNGLLGNLPFARGSLGAIVLLQKAPYADLFEAIETISLNGILVIKEYNLPYLGDVVLRGMGFHRTLYSWHDHLIYRRHEMKNRTLGAGFEIFNAKKVLSPHLVNREIRVSA